MNNLSRIPSNLHIGFVSTRFAGTDGVSLEAEKWATTLEYMGHTCFYFAGEADTPPEQSRVVPEAFFGHPEIDAVQQVAFSSRMRPPEVSRRVSQLKEYLKDELYAFVKDFEIDLLLVENALTIPMNIPLGMALTQFIVETCFPTIAHHHDFFWERKRFLTNCVWDYLNMSFPPNLPSIRHVVINSSGRHQLGLRTGLSSILIPNVMDFDNPPPPPDDYTNDLREALGIRPSEKFILQPTRVVQRKGIEHAIELLRSLEIDARLVISHASGDERDAYEQRVRDFAEMMGVPTAFVADIIHPERGRTDDGRKIYTLGDTYQKADLVTYPSTIEGFGNAFLEAIYYRKPIVVNSYSIYAIDIKPKGFQVIEFDGYITQDTVQQVCYLLEHPTLAEQMAETNYLFAKRYYSYGVLERGLQALIVDLFGLDS